MASDLWGQFLHQSGRNRARLSDQSPLGDAGQDAIVADDDLARNIRVGQGREDDLRALSRLCWARAGRRSPLSHRLHRLGANIIRCHAMPRLQQVPAHLTAHAAEADESDLHVVSLSCKDALGRDWARLTGDGDAPQFALLRKIVRHLPLQCSASCVWQ